MANKNHRQHQKPKDGFIDLPPRPKKEKRGDSVLTMELPDVVKKLQSNVGFCSLCMTRIVKEGKASDDCAIVIFDDCAYLITGVSIDTIIETSDAHILLNTWESKRTSYGLPKGKSNVRE